MCCYCYYYSYKSIIIFFYPHICLIYSILPKPNKTRENGEYPAVHVKEYSTALINVSWVDAERTIIHSDVSETGRFSNAGASTVSGILAIAHSEVLFVAKLLSRVS